MKLNYLSKSFSKIDPFWKSILTHKCEVQLKTIDTFLSATSLKNEIFPPHEFIFRALEMPIEQVRVIILGQDPYHGINQANGLAFAVNDGEKAPPSLRNIFKEIASEYNTTINSIPQTLQHWEQQGVLLLNATLTVNQDQANSHSKIGWQNITDEIIQQLNANDNPKVFILWGNFARIKRNLITNQSHLVLESAHPSPLSAHRGFFGNNHFILANQFLINYYNTSIQWALT